MSSASSTTLAELLRHGETFGAGGFRGSTDDALTPHGLEQMRMAVENRAGWDRIVTSPLRRCLAFANELAQARGVPVDSDERFKEMHFGDWEGKTAEELMRSDDEALLRFWNDPALHTPPSGEPLRAFQARVLAAWNDNIGARRGQHLLLVLHGGPIRVVLGHVLGSPPAALLRFDVPLGSLTRIAVEHETNGLRARVLAASE
jgi:alpha-ribazole phosphatase